MSAAHGRDVQVRMQRIEALVAALESCPDQAAREGARELVRTVLDLHAAGLAMMLKLTSQAGEPGRALVDRFGRDGLVSSLLLLHGLHPVPAERRVAEALDRARARLRDSAADVELLEITGDLVRVRLRGDAACGPALRLAVEEAVAEAAADVPAVVFEEAWGPDRSGRVRLPLLNGGP